MHWSVDLGKNWSYASSILSFAMEKLDSNLNKNNQLLVVAEYLKWHLTIVMIIKAKEILFG